MQITSTPSLFYESRLPDGTVWIQFHRTSDGYRITFPGHALFWISTDGLDTRLLSPERSSPGSVEHLYLNQVIPLALSRQFKLVLHGGAVSIGEDAIALLGLSGQGKSTLTASLATAGYPFLTDDGLQLEWQGETVLAKPSHPSVRLWADSEQVLMPPSVSRAPPVDYSPKARLLAGDDIPHCPEPRPLKAIYFLGGDNTADVRITPVSPRDAMVELVRHSFLLDIEERDMLTHHFGQLSDLVRTLPFFILDYPRDYRLLDKVRSEILGHSRGIHRQ